MKKNEYHFDRFNGTTLVVPDGVNHMFLKKDSSIISDAGSALLITFGCVSLLLLLAVVSIFLLFFLFYLLFYSCE